MNGYLILFFLGGPIFNKKVPLKIQFKSFMVGSFIYLLGAFVLYYLVLQDQF